MACAVNEAFEGLEASPLSAVVIKTQHVEGSWKTLKVQSAQDSVICEQKVMRFRMLQNNMESVSVINHVPVCLTVLVVMKHFGTFPSLPSSCGLPLAPSPVLVSVYSTVNVLMELGTHVRFIHIPGGNVGTFILCTVTEQEKVHRSAGGSSLTSNLQKNSGQYYERDCIEDILRQFCTETGFTVPPQADINHQ
ncbi:Hypothetical predicted protein [Scomber scombrus]|uniref:Uncharacterized protein n=1 Tax=Scomber scombrus TaxID=13677 RepID=A0AAV1N2J3_SCOSC